MPAGPKEYSTRKKKASHHKGPSRPHSVQNNSHQSIQTCLSCSMNRRNCLTIVNPNTLRLRHFDKSCANTHLKRCGSDIKRLQAVRNQACTQRTEFISNNENRIHRKTLKTIQRGLDQPSLESGYEDGMEG